jgi:uncharacterized protein YbcI
MDAAEQSREPQSASAKLTRAIVRLHVELFGRGPTQAKTYVGGEYAICTLSDLFTAPERQLIDAGQGSLVREMRGRLIEIKRAELVAVFEQGTRRSNRHLVTHVDVDDDFAVFASFFDVASKDGRSGGAIDSFSTDEFAEGSSDPLSGGL